MLRDRLGPARTDSLLWGAVGGLAFLVLVQGYELVAAWPVPALAKVGVALLVTGVVAAATHRLRPRLARNERS